MKHYSAERLSELLPHPASDANKYTRGRLVFFGGSEAYPGAAALACMAAQRMGAGYVEAFCASSSVAVLQGLRASLVVKPWEALSQKALETSAGHPAACLVGSGMDPHDAKQGEHMRRVLQQCTLPAVIDGGGLGAIACSEGVRICKARAAAGLTTLLTPHGGEAERLMRGADIEASLPIDRLDGQAACAAALAYAYHATILLKGPQSVVASPRQQPGEPETYVMDMGTAALAKAGTGDVLAGMAAALLAQGLESTDAAFLASALHAEAGRVAQAERSDISVIPEDVIEALPRAIQGLLG